MNIILFEPSDLPRLPRHDPRAAHITEVLRCREGDSFAAGILDGLIGTGTLVAIEPEALVIDLAASMPPPDFDPITLIVGLPRPQTARKVLQEATSMGVRRIHFVRSDLGERSYAHSPLWREGEWRRLLIAGAQQAVTTRLPEVTVAKKLEEVLEAEAGAVTKLAMDNDAASVALSAAELALPATIAIGSERGWSDHEREVLRGAGYTLAHLGTRVLRVETATVTSLALLKSKTGLL